MVDPVRSIGLRRRFAAALLLASALISTAACGDRAASAVSSRVAAADSSVSVRDDAGRMVALARPARRIVTLIPATTETLLAIGAREAIVARTDFDVGMGVDSLPSVGGGLDPSMETIVALKPDLVVGWSSSARPELRERLTELGIPVFSVATEDTADVFRNLANLGKLTGRSRAADSVAASVRRDLEAVRASVAGKPRPTVFFLVWNDPPMTAGPKTFISELIGVAGGRTAFPDATALWPNVSLEEIVRRQPDVVIVPVGEKGAGKIEELRGAPGWRELGAFREGRAVTVPSELVNRPGPRIGETARVLRDAIHGAGTK